MPYIPQIYVVILMAGQGSRFGKALPKQYQTIHSVPIALYSIRTFANIPIINHCYVVLNPRDTHYCRINHQNMAYPLYCGGVTRSESVINALKNLPADDDDWILTHDAARPCISPQDIVRLIESVHLDAIGGVLGHPIPDSMKSAEVVNNTMYIKNVADTNIWSCQTPQMFRYGVLRRCLAEFPDVSDESSAVHRYGLAVQLVRGNPSNIKLTYPEDLEMISALLRTHEKAVV